ncbi:MAG: alpha/beta hydrolase [Woeseiaceae bacterium]
MSLPETVEIEPPGEPAGSVIWLHGLGADGHDFEAIVPELGLRRRLPLRFVFPHAPVRPVTLNGGMPMRAWYDIVSLDRNGPQDETGIRESAALLLGLIAREKERGTAGHRITVAGFSQGGAVALHAALRYPDRLAGLMLLSTWLPLARAFGPEVAENRDSQPRDLPVFMAHGLFDPMLPIDMGRRCRAALEAAGYKVAWHEYPMAHAVCSEEIAAIRDWLLAIYDRASADAD